ncbi:hypothetical protein J6590_078917 [Homalodisca vitripennis]|nr:hypothetical protein J6590_078917 [Homalodisca vitripennis]
MEGRLADGSYGRTSADGSADGCSGTPNSLTFSLSDVLCVAQVWKDVWLMARAMMAVSTGTPNSLTFSLSDVLCGTGMEGHLADGSPNDGCVWKDVWLMARAMMAVSTGTPNSLTFSLSDVLCVAQVWKDVWLMARAMMAVSTGTPNSLTFSLSDVLCVAQVWKDVWLMARAMMAVSTGTNSLTFLVMFVWKTSLMARAMMAVSTGTPALSDVLCVAQVWKDVWLMARAMMAVSTGTPNSLTFSKRLCCVLHSDCVVCCTGMEGRLADGSCNDGCVSRHPTRASKPPSLIL